MAIDSIETPYGRSCLPLLCIPLPLWRPERRASRPQPTASSLGRKGEGRPPLASRGDICASPLLVPMPARALLTWPPFRLFFPLCLPAALTRDSTTHTRTGPASASDPSSQARLRPAPFLPRSIPCKRRVSTELKQGLSCQAAGPADAAILTPAGPGLFHGAITVHLHASDSASLAP